MINVVAERDEFLETATLWEGSMKSLQNSEKKKWAAPKNKLAIGYWMLI